MTGLGKNYDFKAHAARRKKAEQLVRLKFSHLITGSHAWQRAVESQIKRLPLKR